MFGKLVDGKIKYAPSYIRKDNKDIFNYNLESNLSMLIDDGYKEIIDSSAPSEMKNPRKVWKESMYTITATWVDDYVEPTVAELKETKRAEINKARDRAEQGGFEYMGKIFDSDVVSCIRIQGAAQSMQAAIMAEEVPTITWTCKDNTTIDLTAQELLGLSVALAEWSNKCHQKATYLKSQIEEATSSEELEQITW